MNFNKKFYNIFPIFFLIFTAYFTTFKSDNVPLHNLTYSNVYCSFQDTRPNCDWDINRSIWYWDHIRFIKPQIDGPLPGRGGELALVSNLNTINETNISIKSPTIDVNANSACFEFNYYLKDDRSDGKFIYIKLISTDNSSDWITIWSTGSASNFDRWHHAFVQVEGYKHFQLEFVVYDISGKGGFVAIQAMSLRNGVCDIDLCTFESDTCSWHSDDINYPQNLQFKRTLVIQEVKNDHTSNSPYGHVMLVHGQKNGSKALFHSPVMFQYHLQCVTFWYQLSPPLNSFTLKLYDESNYNLLWNSYPNDPINEWIRGSAEVTIEQKMNLLFEATQNVDGSSTIALDDISIEDGHCSPPITCSFNDILCGWKNEQFTNNLLWSNGPGRVENASNLNFNNLSTLFHINEYQHFLYSDFTVLNNKTMEHGSMELLSEIVHPSSTRIGACVQMDIFVGTISTQIDQFYLDQVDSSGQRVNLWNFSDPQMIGKMKTIEMFVPNASNNRSYRLSISANSSNAGTYIAILGIRFQDTKPYLCNKAIPTPTTTTTIPSTTISTKDTLNCDFEENSMCNWKSLDKFMVDRVSSAKFDKMYSPLIDCTLQNSFGHLVYQYNPKKAQESIGYLQAKYDWSNQNICFSFSYYLYADGPSNLEVILKNTNRDVSIYKAFQTGDTKWLKATFTIGPQNETFNYIEFRSLLNEGVLAIDDIQVHNGQCPTIGDDWIRCTFESNTSCVFEPKYRTANSPKWMIYSGMDFDDMVIDHTTQTREGHFIGMDLSHLNKQTNEDVQKFEIESRQSFLIDKLRCLRFSYYFETLQPNISLYYEVDYFGENILVPESHRIWTVYGDFINKWFTHEMKIKIANHAPDYRIRFGIETHGDPGYGRIFLDDIQINFGPCNFVGECDFENGDMCTLESIRPNVNKTLNSDIKSQLVKNRNGTKLTNLYLTDYVDQLWHIFSPMQSSHYVQYDNSLKTNIGKYLLLHGQNKYDRGIIMTERYSLNGDNSICLSFAVYKPDSQAVLEVYQSESNGKSSGIKLWDMSRKSTGWEIFDILATKTSNSSGDLFFFFIGTIEDTRSYIAIDDISNRGNCASPTNLPTTVPGSITTKKSFDPNKQFLCKKNDVLIAIDQLCNWINDCPDGEDEIQCGNCTFSDSNLCRYNNTSDISGDYRFRFGRFSNIGPKHGMDDMVGLMVSSGGYGKATLTSPIIYHAYSTCTMSFEYQFGNGVDLSDETALKVYKEYTDTNERILIWQSNFNLLNIKFWRIISITLYSIRHPFRIVFEANNHNEISGKYHAIDNIKMVNCGPPQIDSTQCLNGFKCSNKVCIPHENVCNFVDDCGDRSDEYYCDSYQMTSFENGFGRWSEGIKRGWKIEKASKMTNLLMGPTYDHTTGITEGSYLFANEKDAEIESPPFMPKTGCQLRFFMYSNSDWSSLMVLLHNINSDSNTMIEVAAISDANFNLHNVPLNYKEAVYTIKFFATIRESDNPKLAKPYIAIDDISFNDKCTIMNIQPTSKPTTNNGNMTTIKPDNCPTISCLNGNGKKVCLNESQICDFTSDCANGIDEVNCGNCTFDDGHTCQWSSNGLVKNEIWKVILPAFSAVLGLPKKDANDSGNGGYLSIYSMISSSNNELVPLQSPVINGPTAHECLMRFSYFSVNGMKLQIRISHDGFIHLLLSVKKTSKQWQSFEVSIGEQKPIFTVDILVSTIYHVSSWMDMAIDNIQWINCNPNKPINPNVNNDTSISCDFENDLCGWEISGANVKSNWYRVNSAIVEPGNDHTGMRIPKPKTWGTWISSQSMLDGVHETDFLVTRVPLKANQTYCLTFWYYFFGIEQDSSLGLFSANPEKDARFEPLWLSTLPLTRNWNQQLVEISSHTSDIYLAFIGNVSSTTVMGLDDISLREHATCQVQSPWTCNFEANLCDWKFTNSGWKRNSASTNYSDHTTGTVNGHYLYIDHSNEKMPGILTKDMNTIPGIPLEMMGHHFRVPLCLKFFYYWDADWSFADNSSYFSVQNIVHTQKLAENNSTLIDTYNNGFSKTWSLFTFDFLASKSTSLKIVADMYGEQTKLLIDDIYIHRGVCKDEGNCDFEMDMCGWTNELVDHGKKRVLWLRIKPDSMFIKGTFLHFDHTVTGTNIGNYLVWPLEMQYNASSVLKSPLLHRKSPKICFSLYYFALASNSHFPPAFLVRLMDLHRNTSIDVRVNTTVSLGGWSLFQHEFSNLPHIYQFNIEANYNDNMMSDIGIDDIKIEQNECKNGLPSTTTPLPYIDKKFDCCFDDGECNWDYDASSWKKTSSEDASHLGKIVPRLDHTKQTKNGKYLLFMSQTDQQSGFTITSHLNLKYDKDYCINFWYYEDGEDPFTLKVSSQMAGKNIIDREYISAIEKRKKWNLIKSDIPFYLDMNDTEIKLIINYMPSSNRQKQFSIFAIDDISVRAGKCGHQNGYTYSFELGYENLDLEAIQPMAQLTGTVVTPYLNMVKGTPPIDHTTYTDHGSYFLFMNNAKPSPPTTYVETLSIPAMQIDHSQSCVRFAYQLKGNVTFKVLIVPNNQNIDHYEDCFPQWQSKFPKDSWTIVQIRKKVLYEHKFVFYMAKPMDKTSFLSLDDITVLEQDCQLPINCDFESNHLCSYSPYGNNEQSKFNFGTFFGPPDDQRWPGPRYDHTTNSFGGGYLYMSAYQFSGSFNRIVSKIISGVQDVDPNQSYCLSLWTQLTSSDLEIHLYLVRYGNSWTDSNRTKLIGSVSGQNQTKWTLEMVSIDSTLLLDAQEIQLLIEGQLNSNSKGVIAIDDITFNKGECQSNDGLICEDGTKLKRDQICNFISDCPSGLDEIDCGDCNFESGLCGWENSTSSSHWSLITFALSGNVNAPKFDANDNSNGHYLLLDKTQSGIISNGKVVLNHGANEMKYHKNAYKTCVMQFDYYINSSSEHVVDVQIGQGSDEWNTIYRIVKSPSGGWRKVRSHIGEHYSLFTTAIDGYLTDGKNGVLAIDNIQFINCSFPKPLAPNKKCPTNSVLCVNTRFCIDQNDLCDYVNDCGDGYDESNCKSPKCNFENSLYTCGITTDNMIGHESKSKVEWSIKTGQFYPDSYYPKIDNTLRTKLGHFIGLQPKHGSYNEEYNMADFYSPMISSNPGTNCHIRFFYFINDEPDKILNTNLKIMIWNVSSPYIETKVLNKFTINVETDMEQRWLKGIVGFAASEPFQFVFRGTLGSDKARIAIDDISFDQNCQLSNKLHTETTTSTTTTNSNNRQTTSTNKIDSSTTDSSIDNLPSNENDQSGKIVAGVLVPIIVIIGVVGYYGYRRYKMNKRNDENLSLTMQGILQRNEYN